MSLPRVFHRAVAMPTSVSGMFLATILLVSVDVGAAEQADVAASAATPSAPSLLATAREHQRAGNYQAASKVATQALELARTANQSDHAAAARLRLASIGIGARTLEATVEHASAAEIHFKQTGNPVGLAQAVNILAIANDELGRRDQALAGYRTYLDLMRRHGSPDQLAWAEHNSGYFLWQKGDLRQAEDHIRAGLEHFLRTGQPDGVSALGRALAAILRAMGDDDGADRESARALLAAREGDSEEALLMALDKRVSALAFAARSGEARELVAEGEALTAAGWSRGHGDFGLARARHYLAAGQVDVALEATGDLTARFDAEGYRLNLANALVLQAQALRLGGKVEAARASAQRAQSIAAALDTAEPRLQAQCLLALLDKAAGNKDAGDNVLRGIEAEARGRGMAVRLPGPVSNPREFCRVD